MANPPPPISLGYSVSTSSNLDTPAPQPDKKPSPSAFLSPGAAARFPPPISQQDQIHGPSAKTPSAPSPSNGIRSSSPIPHVNTLSPSNGIRTGGSPVPHLSTLSPPNGIRTGSPIPHLSTPPGPPVFSSPLRPAAVPFRTSPATPQPMAFSSGSSLPTSSPPQYSHGPTPELQPQGSGATDDSKFDGHSSYVLFSAHKVLKQKKQANVPSLGFGALVTPGREISLGPQIVQRDPHRCQNCGAYANIYCNILLGSGQWQCVICRNLNGSDGEYIAPSKEELRNFPELSSPLVDYVQTGNQRHGFIPVSDSRMSAPIVLVIDECLDEPHLQHLQGSLHAFVDSLPPTTRIGIILYGRMVSVYDFSEGSIASADVLPGDKSPAQESLKALIYGTGVYLSPLHASLPVAHTIFSSLRPYRLNIPETLRDRCLGAAVEVALAIIQGPSREMSRGGVIKRPGGNSRIIVCAGGPCTYGPGSVPHSFNHPNYPHMEMKALKWMEHLGHEAHRHTTVVDILCAGTCPVRVPVLQPLPKASGGVLVLHDDFGEAFGVNLQRASIRSAGSYGLLEIRCSDEILITQVVGPGEEAHLDTHETFKNDTSLAIQMLSVEETQSFSLSMETKGDIKSDHVYFQFAVQYSNAYQAEISRVITVRLPTVDSVSAYLESVQAEVAAVLIAKRTLLRAKNSSEAINMKATIDERIKDVAVKFGSQLPKSKLYRYPKELSLLPEVLFHLRRGPLLGSIVGHEDERSVLRNLFLNASFDLSLRMVAPRCLMHREGGTFEELLAYALAMQSDAAVVLDHGTNVFIWDYDAETHRRDSVEEFYRTNHINQTYDFVKRMREEYSKLNRVEMSIWECCELLNEVVDDSDPDLEEPQIEHLLQTAEAIRRDYPNEDWLHLTGLIHDLGKVLLLPSFGELPQWAVVGDTFPVGCGFDESIVHHKHFLENPDHGNPAYNTKFGVYSEGCGLEKVMMSWGHDDYMYLVAKENKTTLPSAALFIIRYHSFYALHREGAYKHLMNEEDCENLKWLHVFNKYDLYSKSRVRIDVEKVKPYYLSLVEKYFPAKLRW